MSSSQEGVACPGRLDHRRLHFKSRTGSGRCRQALRLLGEAKPGPQAPCGQLPLPGDPGQAGRRTIPPPRPTVPAEARVRASSRPRADSAAVISDAGLWPGRTARGGSGQDGPRPPDGSPKALGSSAGGSSLGRRIWGQMGLHLSGAPDRTRSCQEAGPGRSW